MKLFWQKKAEAEAEPPRGKTAVKKTQAPVARSQVSPRRIETAPRPATTQTPTKILKSDRDLPNDWKLLSNAADIQLNTAMRRQIAVLRLTGAESKSCILISRKDCFRDTTFMDVEAQLLAKGLTIKEYGLTDAGFIAKLYESTTQAEESELSPEARDFAEIIDKELILRALEISASDIHIEMRADAANVFMRVHGILQHVGSWGIEKSNKIFNVLFILADEKTKDTTTSDEQGQSFAVKRNVKGKIVKLRVQTETAYPSGKDVVMRVLPEGDDASIMPFDALGYSPGHLLMLNQMLSTPNGVIVISGTTGSGKSRTLQTLMFDIRQAHPGIKMYSVEDPPEYRLVGVTQIPVRSTGKNAFVATVRNAMRMDPDVLMVGEMRDQETVELVTSLVQTGHKVLTTLHSSSAFDSLSRLHFLGMDFSTMAGNRMISGLIHQYLVPVLCPDCKQEYVPEEWADYLPQFAKPSNVVELHTGATRKAFPADRMKLGNAGIHDRLRQIHRPGDKLFVCGPGCKRKGCHNGVIGRTVVAEMVLLTPKMREEIRSGRISSAEALWKQRRKEGREHEASIAAMTGMTALDHALSKMRMGNIDPAHIEEGLGFLTGYDGEGDEEDEMATELSALPGVGD